MKRWRRLHRSYFHIHILAVCAFLMAGVFTFSVARNIQAITFSPQSAPVVPNEPPIKPSAAAFDLAGMPLLFEPNLGQTNAKVDFVARKGSFQVAVSATSLTVNDVVQHLVKAQTASKGSGELKQESTSNYFIGEDSKKWHTLVPNYLKVAYHNVYPKIDVEYGSEDGQLNYQFTVAPGGDPSKIQLSLDNAKSVSVKDGNLSVEMPEGTMSWEKLHAYQMINEAQVAVDASFVVKGKKNYGFKIGKYDHKFPLVIDPLLSLSFSTFLGGSGDESTSGDTAVDSSGNIVVSGSTISSNFPTASPFQASFGGTRDITVTKFNSTGTAIIWSTYLGGAANESSTGMALDGSNNVYVFGFTNGTGYPLANAYQGTFNGSNDILMTKIAANGASLIYSTYLGGTGADVSTSGLIVDAAGNATFEGRTGSTTDWPRLNAAQPVYGGGTQDMFLTQFSPSGGLSWSTFLGGSLTENATNLAFDNLGNIVVSGSTSSTDFPTLNPFQAALGGSFDGFLAKYTSAGAKLWATYFGATGSDQIINVAVGTTGTITVQGLTASTDFPTVNPFQAANAGGNDHFVSRFNSSANALTWSTYLGGTGSDSTGSSGLAVDSFDAVYVVGRSDSTNFPMVQAYQGTNAGLNDIIFYKFSPNGQTLQFSSYLGGSGIESPSGVTLIGSNTLIFTGQTPSTNFPTTGGAFQPTYGGGLNDDFVVRIAINTHTLTYSSGGGGSISGTSPQSVNDGDSGSTVTAVPNPGRVFTGWSDGVLTASRTDTNVTADISVTANFGENGAVIVVPPSASVVYPNGGENFVTGQTYQISFSSDGRDVQGTRISLSTDGGATYPTIIAARALDLHTYSWTVPTTQPTTTTAKIKVEAIDSSGNALAFDVSDAVFAISAPAVVPPPSGEVPPVPPTDESGPSREELVNNLANFGLAVHDLVKTQLEKGVWYLGADGKRHSFTNIRIYASWYCDFSGVKTISQQTLDAIPFGQNVQYRPGFRMVKSPLNPKVYAIDVAAMLRPIFDEPTAAGMYGPLWNNNIDDVGEMFYADYTFGSELNSTTSFSPIAKSQSVKYPSDAMSIPGYQPSLGTFVFSCPVPLASTQTEAPSRFNIAGFWNWLRRTF